MFKLRRRTVAETAATDHPFCAMCGTTMRVDVSTGRCMLGHRVAAPLAVAPVVAEVADEDTAVLVAPPAEAYEDTSVLPQFDTYEEPVVSAGEGLYEAYSSADAEGRNLTWEDVVAPSTGTSSVYDDYLTWGEPTSDYADTDAFTAEDDAAAPARSVIDPADLLDELNDEAHARRQTFGTIGATIAVTAMVAGSVALLPF